MDQDSHDPSRLRVEIKPAGTFVKPRKWRRHYVRVPWAWVERLRATKRVSTYQLALVLLYEHWRTGGKEIVLSNVAMQAEGLTRRSKWNALVELAELGLVTFERKPRRSPRVVLHQTSDAQP
jgi:hypothetical protein